MNKTVNINLGGFPFTIDEDAFQKLSRYFDAIKRSLSADGRDEIMNDIESRVAELLAEKLSDSKQVVGLTEIDQVIAVMGQPEDYRIEDENEKTSYTTYNPTGSKKLYRDKEKGMLGGVLAGFGHYFGVDPLWLRIIMVILLFSWGIGIIPYIIFWILVPEAKTTAEKLEMTGQPITISNIEKKVKEGFAEITDTVNNIDHQKIADNAKSGAQKVGSSLEEIIMTIFKAIAKVLGAFIVVISASSLIGLLIASIMLIFSSTMPDAPWFNYINAENYTDIPMWLLGILSLLAIGIPFFFFFLLGLKLLISNLKSIGNYAKFTLLAVWIISVIALIYYGVRQATEIGFDGKVVKKEQLLIQPNDTLNIKFRFNDYFSKTASINTDFRFTQDSAQNEVIYSNNIELHLLKTADSPYIQIERTAEGKSLADARSRAEKIKYSFEIQGNTVILDNYLLTDIENKYRNQKVKIFLYLPEGTVIHPDTNTSQYLDNDYSNYYFFSDDESYYYKMEKDELKCLNCPAEEENEDWHTEENDTTNAKTTTVTLNENGLQIKESKKVTNKEVEGIKVTKDEVIIKTKN
ncbi:PspC domain-containing protein [Flavobacterium sp.]|uniref:PspC domain-containing protein n=1 Tax=Flavobacterium sp. TaxID=239 RepID=UPI0028BD7900|nr:PspC domain-containing protein [Flavobacterium sp.]